MHDETILLDENFPSCFRVAFRNREAAEAVADRIRSLPGVEAAQVNVIAGTEDLNGFSETAGMGAARTGRKADYYLKFALAGLLVGGLCAAVLIALGVQNSQPERGHFFAAFCALGLLSAAMLAALTSWRPRLGSPRQPAPAPPHEKQFYALEIEARNLSEHHELRQALEEIGAPVTHVSDAGTRKRRTD